jgi:hypothetical protein
MKACLVEFQRLTVGIKEGQWMGERGEKGREKERDRMTKDNKHEHVLF